MEKLKRIDDRGGSGSGNVVFSEGPVQVTHWQRHGPDGLYNDTRLCISAFGPEIRIRFDGHQTFKSVGDCLSQLTSEEFAQLLQFARDDGVEKGKELKMREIREALGMYK